MSIKLAMVLLALYLALLGSLTVAWMPCTVESRQYVLTPDGYIEEPCTLHTAMWAKVLWDNGYDLYYTQDGGVAMPGGF